MKFINKILQLALMIVFLALVYSLTILGVFSSNQKFTKLLDESGFYEASSKLMSNELNKQINSNNSLLNEAIKNSITSSVTSDVAKSVIAPAQIGLLEWLNSNQKTLSIDLDLLPIKNKVGTKTADSQIKFEITRLLPDSFILLEDSKDENNILPQLIKIKQSISLIKETVPYLWIAIGIISALLFLLNIGSGSKKFNRIFAPLMIASIFGVFISLASSFASTSIGLDLYKANELDSFQVITKVILTVVRDTLLTFSAIGIIAFLGILLSKLLFKSKDKHLKKKKK